MKTIRIASINMLHRDLGDRYETITESLSNLNADAVFMQEICDLNKIASLMAGIGLKYHTEASRENKLDKLDDYVVIFSKTPVEFKANIDNGIAVVGQAKIQDIDFYLTSAHFSWGAQSEPTRLLQAEKCTALAEEFKKEHPKGIAVLGGDFNADEDSRTIRYLTGKDLNHDNTANTFWTDAWSVSGSEHNWVTTRHAVNHLAEFGSHRAGISNVNYLPERRIDYLMTLGWNYGRSGTPVAFGYIDGPEEMSDHKGIYADIAYWD